MAVIEKFARYQIDSLIERLQTYILKKESENLHDIRVHIKKIKALLLFINDRVKGFKAHKNYLPFRAIFRRANEIREPEVLSGLLLANNIPGVHNPKIEGSQEKLIENFCDDIPSFIRAISKQWVKLKPVLQKLKQKDLDKYLHKVEKDIKANLSPKPNMKIIHKTRKLIKVYIYLSQVDSRNKLTKFYSKQAEIIGDLHDNQQLLKLLSTQNGLEDKTLTTKIQNVCDSQSEEIKKAALNFYRALN